MVDESYVSEPGCVDEGTDDSKKHIGICFNAKGEEITIEYEGLQTGSDGGKKCDESKTEMDLLFDAPEALEMVAKVLEFGKKKYGRCNWKTVTMERYRSALQRHFLEIKKGNIWDNGKGGTGQLHWSNIVCCALFCLQITIDELKENES